MYVSGYRQRQIFVDRSPDNRKDANEQPHENALHSLIFNAIAGDVTVKTPGPLKSVFQIQHIQFGMMDATTVRRICPVLITSPMTTGTAIGNLSDARMGAQQDRKCSTCRNTYQNCPGHFGRVELPHAVFNPMFLGLLVNVLQCLCVSCRRLRISPWYIQATISLNRVSILKRLKAISVFCQRFAECAFCRASCLQFKLQGLGIIARTKAQTPWLFVPPLW